MSPTNRVSFLDCQFDAVTSEESAERVLHWCEGDRRPRVLATINAALLVMMRDDPALAQAVTNADLIVADGVPVVWATRMQGTPLPARVAGCDLMQELMRIGADKSLRVFFLGATQEVIDDLIAVCETTYPGLMIAGTRNGYFGEDDHDDIVSAVAASDADILFIGMPSPFKEVWGERHRDALGVPVIMGVGGSFDVVTGHVKRAPEWMQKAGLEWFWRFLMEPRKMWKRYLVTNTRFILLTARAVAGSRFSRKGGSR